jgi:hypothetical protein
MGGSKKGEHRGNAKKRALEGDILSPAATKPERAPRRRDTEAYLHQVVRYVNNSMDEPGMLPRDAIQRAQDFFQKEAAEAIGYYDWLLTLVGQPMSREDAEELEQRMQATKREARSLMAEMSNQAFKNLPYFHAKASPDATDETNPIEIMRTLLREIDDMTRGRPTWMKEEPKLISDTRDS